MPRLASESVLVTIFVDVHYLMSPEGQRPLRDRFEKGSYAYIYRDQKTARLRLEIANNVGKSYQDAFAGSLDYADIRHTPERPLFLSFVAIPASFASSQVWLMYDQIDNIGQGQRCQLYGIDMYFWTPREAAAFIGAIHTDDHTQHLLLKPLNPAESGISPLEDSTYPSVRDDDREALEPTTKSILPLSPPSSGQYRQPSAELPPVPYNPAGPIASERFGAGIEGDLNCALTSTDRRSHTYGLSNESGITSSSASQQRQSYVAPVNGFSPQRGLSYQLLSKTRSSPSPAISQASKVRLSPTPGDHGYFPPPPPLQPQGRATGLPTQHDTFPVVLRSSTTPVSSLFVEAKSTAPLAQSILHSPAHRGADYAYDQSASPDTGNADSVHSELYRRTEAAANSRSSSAKSSIGAVQASASGKLEMRAERLEKGVNRFFKKLDSKWA